MNAIQQAKRALSAGLIFKLSQIGFALRSTLCYTNRVNVGIHDYAEYAAQLHEGDSVFISTRESEVPIHTLVAILRARNVRVVFYIMEEPLVAWEFVERLLPVSIRIFVQNNEYDHPKVHIMPIGIRDCGTIVLMHHRFHHSCLFILFLWCFVLKNTNHKLEVSDGKFRSANIKRISQYLLLGHFWTNQ
jgi:hypothetical protein